MKNDAIFDDLAKKVLPKSTQNGQKKAQNQVERENKKLKEKLVYLAVDNFVKGKELNSIKLDFWKQQETYLDLKSDALKA